MTQYVRRAVFYLLIFVFIVGGTGTTLYASGWRFDAATFKLQKVGAIYIRSFPKEAGISLNDEPTKNASWLLENGTFIGNLTPGDYRVRLTAPGYRDFQETLAVRPSLVTERRYALLVPARTTPATESTLSRLDVLTMSEDRTIILTKSERGVYSIENTLASTSINIGILLRKAGFETSAPYSVHLDSNDPLNVLVLETNGIHTLNTNTGTLVDLVTAKSITTFTTSPTRIAWGVFDKKTGVSTVSVMDRAETPFTLATTTVAAAPLRLAFHNDDALFISGAGNTLYRFDLHERTTEKIAGLVRDFALTDDHSKLAMIEDGSIAVTSYAYPPAGARFAVPDIQRLARISWYRDNEHLFLQYENPNRLALLDLHDSNLENLQTIAENTEKTAYDPRSNKLYILKDGKVESMEFSK